jgi:hypothetical protein
MGGKGRLRQNFLGQIKNTRLIIMAWMFLFGYEIGVHKSGQLFCDFGDNDRRERDAAAFERTICLFTHSALLRCFCSTNNSGTGIGVKCKFKVPAEAEDK